jgi:riboflavin kinase
MVMSIGFNPFYKNTVRSAEVHVLHEFKKDFYGSQMAISIVGFIRPEYDYVSKESLIADIKTDMQVTRNSLERKTWLKGAEDKYLWGGVN